MTVEVCVDSAVLLSIMAKRRTTRGGSLVIAEDGMFIIDDSGALEPLDQRGGTGALPSRLLSELAGSAQTRIDLLVLWPSLVRVFGTAEKAESWLKSHNPGLEGQRSTYLLGELDWMSKVYSVLERIRNANGLLRGTPVDSQISDEESRNSYLTAGPVDPDQIFTALARYPESRELAEALTSGKVWYEGSRTHPGQIDRIQPDGNRETGRWVDNEFVPDQQGLDDNPEQEET